MPEFFSIFHSSKMHFLFYEFCKFLMMPSSVVANFQKLELGLAAHIFAVGIHPEITCQISDL